METISRAFTGGSETGLSSEVDASAVEMDAMDPPLASAEAEADADDEEAPQHRGRKNKVNPKGGKPKAYAKLDEESHVL